MNITTRRIRWLPVAVSVLLVGVAGCSSSTPTTTSPGGMMGGGAMMGADSTYHYAPLICTAPGNLPGQRITVVLGDMGMTAMQSGTAPMGALSATFENEAVATLENE